MTEKKWRAGQLCLAGALALLGGYLTLSVGAGPTPALSEENSVTFPQLDELVHYTTIRRGTIREDMFTTRAALDAIQAGNPVPTGTQVIVADHLNEVLHRYLVSQKTGDGVGDWQFQWFHPDKSIKADENTAQCYACHRSRQDRQFMFTFSDALGFK